jgi:hypothetical protein
MAKASTEVQIPSLMEALEDRFADWEILHRIVPSGPNVRTGGNGVQAEAYHFIGVEHIMPDGARTYRLHGRCRKERRDFHIEVDAEGNHRLLDGDHRTADHFIEWLKDEAGWKRFEQSLKDAAALEAEVAAMAEQDAHDMAVAISA